MAGTAEKQAVQGGITVPIVFCSDDGYAIYIPVIVQSVLDCASPQNTYVIIIFDCGIKEKNLDMLRRQLAPHKNFRLQISNVENYLEANKKAFVVLEEQHLSPATYARLLIPQICADYDRVIYADIDMAFSRDPAELMRVDIGDNYAAGCVDANLAAERRTRAGIGRYMRTALGLADDQAYINSGLMIFNAALWRRKNLVSECLSLLAARRFKRHDQDTINYICRGRIHYLSSAWNTACKLADSRPAPAGGAVFHYVGAIKPWHNAAAEKGALWWRCARRTEVYDDLLVNALTNKAGLYLDVGSARCSLLGLPLCRVKVAPKKRKYYLFGLPLAKMEINAKKREKAFLLLGLKIFRRRPQRG